MHTIHDFPFFSRHLQVVIGANYRFITGDFSFFGSPTKKKSFFPRIRSSRPTRERENAVNLECWTRPQHHSERRCKLFGRILVFFGVCFRCNKKLGRNLVVFFLFWAGFKKGDFQEICDFFGSFVVSLITMTSHCLKIYRKSRFWAKFSMRSC